MGLGSFGIGTFEHHQIQARRAQRVSAALAYHHRPALSAWINLLSSAAETIISSHVNIQ
jgi:hypothetical protein